MLEIKGSGASVLVVARKSYSSQFLALGKLWPPNAPSGLMAISRTAASSLPGSPVPRG
jgi:hypothetical protein